ncbi:sensor histidine kinase [Paenibacillus pinistramenti]|uniref:ATP-binding protein n=1 Tax=Paenibacillus pinistramenti TaxID=1768003 RepID=UPI001109A227|nr:sensor histidine kinase [Paenibacillus pinistramenti]
MLLEKLLLNVLIVLSPILVYLAIRDRLKPYASPYLIGLLLGIASSLCLIFSFQAMDLFWDLRYVPLIISTIYGGPLAGAINFILILLTRTYLGGDALLFGYASIALTFAGILLSSLLIKKPCGRERVNHTVMTSLVPSAIMLLILVIYSLSNDVTKPAGFHPFIASLLFGSLQTLATWIPSLLLEFNFAGSLVKEEHFRAEKLKTLGEVAASIAHEIRNPLTTVQGFLQLMRANGSDHKSRDYLQIALDELNRAESVIRDYLTFSKPKLSELESFCLADLVQHITATLTPIASYKGVSFDCRLISSMYIYTDRGQLQQALVNVVKNAIEASSDNSIVRIMLSLHRGQAELKIIDSGKGMTKEEIERIGTLFYTTKENGTGLGTSVAVSIIQAMNGKILYESQKGRGTVCIISLPLEAKGVTGLN